MKDLAWGSILSVGIEEIDSDHRTLINLFNMLNHSVTEGASREYVGAVFEELINCTAWHFSHEERLMLEHDYEGIEEHKAEHRDLIKSVKDLQQKFFQAGKLEEKDDLEFLKYWLTEHILVADMKLGSHLLEAM